jgi:hypothetical protein
VSRPRKIEKELRRHLSNFISDLDKIGKIIEEAKPHHALIARWRRLKFEMEGDLNDALKIVNNKASQPSQKNSSGIEEKAVRPRKTI